eukprot:3269097-Rhodomonas_salina.1
MRGSAAKRAMIESVRAHADSRHRCSPAEHTSPLEKEVHGTATAELHSEPLKLSCRFLQSGRTRPTSGLSVPGVAAAAREPDTVHMLVV